MKRKFIYVKFFSVLALHPLLIGIDFILSVVLRLKKNFAFSSYNYLNRVFLLNILGKRRIHEFDSLSIVDKFHNFRLLPKESFDVSVKLLNTSNSLVKIPQEYTSFFGKEGPLRIGTINPKDHHSLFHCDGWESRNRIKSFEELVLEGKSLMVFACPMKAPDSPGKYQESFGLVYEGFRWLNDDCIFNLEVEVVDANTGMLYDKPER
jgi:hypothetical protein